MKYIIMCGGDYSDWWKTPRHLLEFQGEPLVARTIRLLREAGVDDIAISATDKCFEGFGVPVVSHDNSFNAGVGGHWCEAFYPMDEPAVYLMGDVVFSSEAIKTIVRTKVKSVMFFASAPPFNKKYIKSHAEPFGFKVIDQKRFRAAIDFVIANEDTGIFLRRPISWELWQVLNGDCVRTINFNNYEIINDYTCDVDKLEDIARLEKLF